MRRPGHTMALVSTAGVARTDDRPFDQDGERRDPWWGDPGFRVIPLGTTEKDVRLYHLRIGPRFGEADLDVLLPIPRAAARADEIVRELLIRHTTRGTNAIGRALDGRT